MKNTATVAILSGMIFVVAPAAAQQQKNLAQRLGYEADAKLLIVHADDIGLARSVNIASVQAFENGGITSGSVMVPCPWFPDFAAYYRELQPLDVGIHITLTAEWDYYKWGGISPAGEISSLLDENGHFYSTVEEVGMHAEPAEVEKEIRAQIERALALGIKPTHLDTHMGSVMATPELLQIYFEIGREYGLPVLTIPQEDVPEEYRDALVAQDGLVDGLYMMYADDSTQSWSEAYGEMIAAMEPGLNQLIVHLAIDDTEMQAVAVNHPDFGSAWRQKDLDFVTSKEFRDLLEAHDIKLVSWDQIRKVM
ncbi:MAG: polysaccharide deacetylase family protein [Gemmatimonadota bacterium]|nr:MAG: polysaccharide deacetylase family protein [Gemmatimonadota bacterium]